MDKSLTTTLDYAPKAPEYFAEARSEMLAFVPETCHRLLDVGCGAGRFGASLKQSREIEVWGVESFATAAAQAARQLDRVINRSFEPDTDLPPSAFDCIVFNDVLEHMAAPEQALRYARLLLSPGRDRTGVDTKCSTFPGSLATGSARYLGLRGLGFVGSYACAVFTKSSILKLFASEGYTVRSISGINPYVGIPNVSQRLWAVYRLANVLCLNKFADLKFQQFAVVAQPSATS